MWNHTINRFKSQSPTYRGLLWLLQLDIAMANFTGTPPATFWVHKTWTYSKVISVGGWFISNSYFVESMLQFSKHLSCSMMFHVTSVCLFYFLDVTRRFGTSKSWQFWGFLGHLHLQLCCIRLWSQHECPSQHCAEVVRSRKLHGLAVAQATKKGARNRKDWIILGTLRWFHWPCLMSWVMLSYKPNGT